jgi:hypothetical protein
MPGSSTTPGRPYAGAVALVRVAFHTHNSVVTRGQPVSSPRPNLQLFLAGLLDLAYLLGNHPLAFHVANELRPNACTIPSRYSQTRTDLRSRRR